MKLKLMLTACFVALGLSTQAKDFKYETVQGDPMQTRIYTLDNGLKVYLSVNKETPRLQANIAVRTGSRNDPAETTGLAHYLEHLMFKGTKLFGTSNPDAEQPLLDEIEQRYEKYRLLTDPEERRLAYHEIDSVSQIAAQYFIPNEYDKLMSAIGSSGTNAYTSYDVTCYVENIPSNEIENWVRIQADRFQNMVIRGFHTELEAVYEEFNIGLARDANKVYDAMLNQLCAPHPYGTQTTIGTQEHLKNPSITNIKNYFHRYYVPNNCAVVLAGDFDPDEVIQIIDRYFGSWKRSDTLSRPEYAPLKPITARRDTTVIGQEAEQVWMCWRFNGANDAQVDTLDVIENLLSNGKAGLCDINIEQAMKAQGVGAGALSLADYSVFIMMGVPKEGQSLEDLRDLLLDEMSKLKQGDFSDDLLPSIINNKKFDFYRSLENNRTRASYMVDAFINNQNWADFVERINRQSKMTKEDIVAFANRHFGDNFVTVFKRQGEDTTQKKIDKPAITAIPTNRDMASDFLKEIQNTKVKDIEPQFLDFDRDLTVTKTKKGLPLLYKQNTEDGIFNLQFRYNFGQEDMLDMLYAADYLDYIGTTKKSLTQINQEFYKLACSYDISVGDDETTVSLTGLTENMPAALALYEELIHNAKADAETYNTYIDMTEKNRADQKANQRANYQALTNYVEYGPYNPYRNARTADELRAKDPQKLVDLLKQLSDIEHTVLYYGPMTEKELNGVLAKAHKTPKKLTTVAKGPEYTLQTTPVNEVYIAPYVAKNIYMTQFHNENKPNSLAEYPVRVLFNEYFGGSMNGIVFQELRESRGLAYNASAMYNSPLRLDRPEWFMTHIIAQNDKLPDCIVTFNDIMNNLPQSEAAFEIAKQSVIKSYQSSRTRKMRILTRYYDLKKYGYTVDPWKTTYEALPSLTLQDVVRFEQTNMANKPFKYIILGDEKELDMDTLEKIGPIHRLTTDEIFGY